MLAVLAVTLLTGCGDSSKPKPISVRPIRPIGLSLSGLRTLAHAVPQPIYWAGPRPGVTYELQRTSTGYVYLRYLPPGAKVGSNSASVLVVATYPSKGALDALKKVAGSAAVTIPHGGIAFPDTKDARSVHLAYPRSNYQVEVYSPSPVRSLGLARSGAVRPVA